MWESHSYGSERDGAATANPGAPRLLDPAACDSQGTDRPQVFESSTLSHSGGKPETWKWFRLKGVRNPSGKV